MSSSAHVPRPANAFICFRSRFIREQKAQLAAAGTDQPRTQQTDWSRLAGDRWHAMSAFERQEYFDMSERIAREHKAMHPDYKYQPRAGAATGLARTRSRRGSTQHDEEEEEEMGRNSRNRRAARVSPVAQRQRRSSTVKAEPIDNYYPGPMYLSAPEGHQWAKSPSPASSTSSSSYAATTSSSSSSASASSGYAYSNFSGPSSFTPSASVYPTSTASTLPPLLYAPDRSRELAPEYGSYCNWDADPTLDSGFTHQPDFSHHAQGQAAYGHPEAGAGTYYRDF